MTIKESPKLRTTKDYSMFVSSDNNRPTDDSRKRLMESMKAHGYLAAYPLFCIRTSSGKLEIQDGQHRLLTAQTLGLAVWYVILNEQVNIANLCATQKTWVTSDYAKCYAAQGKSDYVRLLEFVEKHKIPVALAAAVLAGTCSYSNCRQAFVSGTFKIKNSSLAETVATIYGRFYRMSSSVRNVRLLAAVYAVCMTSGFDPARMIENAARCQEKLVSYSTTAAYLAMLEDIYNFGRKNRVAIKVPAENIMRERNPVNHIS